MMMAQNATEGNLKGYEDAAQELFAYARQAATEGSGPPSAGSVSRTTSSASG